MAQLCPLLLQLSAGSSWASLLWTVCPVHGPSVAGVTEQALVHEQEVGRNVPHKPNLATTRACQHSSCGMLELGFLTWMTQVDRDAQPHLAWPALPGVF